MFNKHHGDNVKLAEKNQTANRTNNSKKKNDSSDAADTGNNAILSAEPLVPGQPFTVLIRRTEGGGWASLCLGVTTRNPNIRPILPKYAYEMTDSWCVFGPGRWQCGKDVGEWRGNLRVSPGDKVGVVWDDQVVSIAINDTTVPVFTDVCGPVWALTEVRFVTKMSVMRQEPLPVETQSQQQEQSASAGSQGQEISVPRPDLPPKRPGAYTPWGLPSAMNEMSLGEAVSQSMGASGGFTPGSTSYMTCPYWQVCARFIDSLNLPAVYLDLKFDCCYCISCMIARGDNLYYKRGVPQKLYGLPCGWCRFGLSAPAKAHGLDAFPQWHVAYHGTIPTNIQTIIESDLLMPGDYNIEGRLLAPPPGHFTETNMPRGFNIKQVFVSPTIAYAGHPVYAKPQCWTDPNDGRVRDIQVALQVRIKPYAYQVGKETLGLGSKILDARFQNSELEWSTKIRGATILQGILVKYS